jgi:hypothetical protein
VAELLSDSEIYKYYILNSFAGKNTKNCNSRDSRTLYNMPPSVSAPYFFPGGREFESLAGQIDILSTWKALQGKDLHTGDP